MKQTKKREWYYNDVTIKRDTVNCIRVFAQHHMFQKPIEKILQERAKNQVVLFESKPNNASIPMNSILSD